MDNRTDKTTEDPWVAERLAVLNPAPEWNPDGRKAFETWVGRKESASKVPWLRVSMAASILAATGVVLLLLPWRALWSPEGGQPKSHPVAQNAAAQVVSPFQVPEKDITVTFAGPAATRQASAAVVMDPKSGEILALKPEAGAPEPKTVETVAVPTAQSAVTPPKIVNRVLPKYTEEAKQAKIQGTVILEVAIQRDGIPKVLSVVQSLGYGLDESASAAVEQWRFEPGTQDGKPIDVIVRINVDFKLK